MSYDLSGVKASNGKPKGKYNLKCLAAKVKKSQKGEDMFALEFCIKGENFNNFKIYDNFMLQGNGAQYAMPKLAYLMDQIEVPRDAISDSTPWLNKMVTAEIGQDKDGRNIVKEYSKLVEEAKGEDY